MGFPPSGKGYRQFATCGLSSQGRPSQTLWYILGLSVPSLDPIMNWHRLACKSRELEMHKALCVADLNEGKVSLAEAPSAPQLPRSRFLLNLPLNMISSRPNDADSQTGWGKTLRVMPHPVGGSCEGQHPPLPWDGATKEWQRTRPLTQDKGAVVAEDGKGHCLLNDRCI